MRRRPVSVLGLACAAALLVAVEARATCPSYGEGPVSSTIPDASSIDFGFGVARNGTVTSLGISGLRVTHPAIDDLEIHLISPSGTDVVIVDRVCPGSADLDIDLDDAAGSPIACPPTDGQAHTPSNPLSAFLGEPAAGTWTLRILDRAAGNTGYFNNVRMPLCASCADTPATFTFDAGNGAPHCYYEGALKVCAYYVVNSQPFPYGGDSTVQLGDNDGDASPDIANSANGSVVRIYEFSLGGAPFAVTGFDFTYDSGTHGFTSSKTGGAFTVSATGHVTPPAGTWSGITKFTWSASNSDPPGAVMDNLAIVAQCCGDGVLDPGEQCEDGNFADGDCCASTCQFEASGSSCAVDGNVCTGDVCDGAGTCAHPDIPPPCSTVPACGVVQTPAGPDFDHPRSTKPFSADLVQAFVGCGLAISQENTTTEGGYPACAPPQTPNERAGSPVNGWRWAPTGAQGRLQLKPLCPGAGDLGVTLKLAGVADGAGMPASGHGTVRLEVRPTVRDPIGGTMTTEDQSVDLGFTLVDGKVSITSTLDAMLSERGTGPLPTGTAVEILPTETVHDVSSLGVAVLDPNGNTFALPGVFLEPDAQCTPPHPAKARKMQMGFVGAFGGCNNAEDGYQPPNAVTENGIAACAPAQPYYEVTRSMGSWRWDATRGKALVQLKAAKSAPSNALNPPGDTSDVAVALKMKGILDAFGFGDATGQGWLGLSVQVTARDRINGNLTTEYYLPAPISVAHGSGKMKSSIDTLLNGASPAQPGLPHCAAVTPIGAVVSDPATNWFALGGLYLR